MEERDCMREVERRKRGRRHKEELGREKERKRSYERGRQKKER